MEMHHAPCDSPNDGHDVLDELEELQSESLDAAERTSMGTTKRQFWLVQVRSMSFNFGALY